MRHVKITTELGMGDRATFNAIDARVRRGEWDELFAAINNIEGIPDLFVACLKAKHDPSLIASLLPQLEQYLEDQGGNTPSEQFIDCLSMAGEPDRAAKLALAAIEDTWFDLSLFWRGNGPTGTLRQTEVFRQVLRDMGLLDFYHNYGWPDLCHPVGEDDFKCDL